MRRPLLSNSQQYRSALLNRNSGGWSKQDLQRKEHLCSDSWSHQLPDVVLELILDRLGLLDRIRLGAVCSSWRAAVARLMETSVLEFPLVLYDVHTPSMDGHLLYNLVDDIYYSLNPVYTKGCRIINVIEGRWLVMVLMENCGGPLPSYRQFIWNPVTGKQFKLPPVSTISAAYIGFSYSFSTIVASSQPTDSKCLVAGLSESCFSLVFCRLGDSKWTRLFENGEEVRSYQFADIILIGRKLYVSTSDVDKFVIVFDLRHGENKEGVYKTKTIVVAAPLPISYGFWGFGDEGRISMCSFNKTYMKFAADSVSGELLCILYNGSKKSPQLSRSSDVEVEQGVQKFQSFSVYKMDGIVGEKNNGWTKVEDIGDRLLFFSGKYSSFFVPTKEFRKSIQGNAMFYTLQFGSGWAVGKYCLNKQTIIQYCTPELEGQYTPQPEALPSKIDCATYPVSWFIPTIF